MKRVFLLLSVKSFIMLSYLNAQENDWATFTKADGLAHNGVVSVYESSDGAIWAGTWDGVGRYYDGSWTTFTTANTDSGLIDQFIVAIIESSDGAMWFGSYPTNGRGGASRFYQGKWTPFTIDSGLVRNDVTAIIESDDGALWFGTPAGVSRYYQGRWDSTLTSENSGLVLSSVGTIFTSSDGALWFGTGAGVSRYYDGHWETFTTEDGLAHNSVNAIHESNDGAMWFGTVASGGVSRYHQGKWTTFNSDNSGLADNFVFSIHKSADGTLWFGTWGHGVSSYYHGSWTTYNTGDGLGNDRVNAIYEASDGTLWFGTGGGGVSRFFPEIWTTFNSTNSELAGNIIPFIYEASDSSLWFGTSNQGVSRYYQGAWTTLTIDDGLADNRVVTIIEASNGALWFGHGNLFEGEGMGVSRFYQGEWDYFTTANGLIDNNVFVIFESSDDALWFGTDGTTGSGGVSRYYQENWTEFNTASGLVSNDISAIFESSDGALWFGTREKGFSWERYGGGVSRYYQGEWTTFTTDSGLANNSVSAITESSDGAIWFGTAKGATRYHLGEWTSFGLSDGLADSVVLDIVESSDGALWFGTFEGGASRYYHGEWTTLTTADGLVSRNVGTIIESSYGALWFGNGSGLDIGTNGGGVSRLKPDRLPPLTFIVEGPESLVGTSTSLFIISAKDNHTNVDKIVFSYVLAEIVGDSQPNPDLLNWLPYTGRTAIETEPLQNGTYIFYVRARDTWGNLDATPATRTFTVDITPPTVTFNSHKAGDNVAGDVILIGNAFDASPIQDFQSYIISYGFGPTQDDITRWNYDRFSIYDSTKKVQNDTLAIWDTNGLPNGTYTLWLHASDTLGHTSDVYLPLEVVKSLTDISPRDGTTLLLDTDRIQLYIPPNALQQQETLIIKETDFNNLNPLSTTEITFTNLSFVIEPASLRLSKPGTMTIGYPDLSALNINDQKLAIYTSPDGQNDWKRLGGLVNATERTITTSFQQFGVFALYEDLTEGGESEIFNVNIQPRVFSPNGSALRAKADISFELGKAATVNVKIYNTAGRLIAVLVESKQMNRGVNVVSWHGQDLNSNTCPSGLYVVTIEAESKTQTKTVVIMNQ